MTRNPSIIVGVDEVGRGCLAGPLCVGAVALKDKQRFVGLKDSKLMTLLQRQKLSHQIKQKALAIGLGWASSTEIDELGMTGALKLATKRALDHIHIEYDRLVIDGNLRLSEDPRAEMIPKADATVQAVSAAAVVAKVARDRYMEQLDSLHPAYQFAKHKGYATALHRQMLQENGPSPMHRRSFKQVRELL